MIKFIEKQIRKFIEKQIKKFNKKKWKNWEKLKTNEKCNEKKTKKIKKNPEIFLNEWKIQKE